MKRIVGFVSVVLFFICFIFSCSVGEKAMTVELTSGSKVTFPADDKTYCISTNVALFENEGKEYLFFLNTERLQHSILIFDMEKQELLKHIEMHEDGPNVIYQTRGGLPLDLDRYLIIQVNNMMTIVNDSAQAVGRVNLWGPELRKSLPLYGSLSCRSYNGSQWFMKDSVYYFQMPPNWSLEGEAWHKQPMFGYWDLRKKLAGSTKIYYPEYTMLHQNYRGFSSTFAHTFDGEHLVVSYAQCDSILVSSDFVHSQWHNAQSRYLNSMHPTPFPLNNATSGVPKEAVEMPRYWQIVYDKYRKVYYRFAELPYEMKPDEHIYDEPAGREFSIVILNQDFEIIGETKFPGNMYFYKMYFVGKEGLYISENNFNNPDFDEDKIVFRCFKLKDIQK